MIFFKIEDLAKRSTILSPWDLRINDFIAWQSSSAMES